MKSERVATDKKPTIRVSECNGSLVIRGWDNLEILVKGDDYQLDESDAGFSITAAGSLKMMVPSQSTLSVDEAHGDLSIKNVTGDVTVEKVRSDAVFVALGSVRIGVVHGDLSVKKVDGQVRADTVHGDMLARSAAGLVADTVHGDLSARFIQGAAELGDIAGDISLNGIEGDVSIAQGHRDANLRNLGGMTTVKDIRGDIRLHGGLSSGKHSLIAGGDIVIRWPEGAPLTLSATAPKIVNRMTFDETTETKGTLAATRGNDPAILALEAGGNIILKEMPVTEETWGWSQEAETGPDLDFVVDMAGLGERIGMQVVDLAGLGERIGMQLNEHVARITSELEHKLGPEYSQRFAEKIARKAERAAARAEREAERAMRIAERRMRRAGWHGQRQQPRRGEPSMEKRKATSEEQLKILKMVEQGIITTDEASTLLEALDS